MNAEAQLAKQGTYSGKFGWYAVGKGFEIEKRKIHMDDHIKTIGEFSIPIRLFKDVTAHIKLKVEAEAEA